MPFAWLPLVTVAAAVLASTSSARAEPVAAQSSPATPARTTAAELGSSRRVRLETIARSGRGFVAQLEGGANAELTLDPRMQDAAEEVFHDFRVPYGAAVVISVPDGRVLALAGHSSVSPELGPAELALHAWAPAASVFKIVSATALIEGGLRPDSRTCYHGGVSAVLLDNLVDSPRIDRSCATLAYAIGKSQNAILAKLASHHLTPEQLGRVARSFGFGEVIPFDVPIEPSFVDIPVDNKLEFARTAAGFWHSTLSPLHGALLAAAVANRGEMPAPILIERAIGSEGQRVEIPPLAARTVMSAAVAREVGQMMELTTRMGTARMAFNDRKGRPLLPVSVAGKTGTLSAETDKGYVGYSWFIGYAPADRPQIAFAVVLGNRLAWRIKAPYVARRLVAAYLAGARERGATRLLAAAR